MNSKLMPEDGERLIQDALAELGWAADATAVAERVRRLDLGLPVEDEFAVVCSWLGNCRLLHKLDQQQVPVSSKQEFQVPDLLARFSTQNGKSPVLIEVKSKQERRLSLRPEYLQRLQNYADMVGMPLLIAWKFHSLWTLFEVKHLTKAEKNFNISFEKASQESLMGVLAGDVAYKIGAGAGIHLRLRKDRLIERVEDERERSEQWAMTIDDVSFTDYKGMRRTDLTEEVQSLFTAWDLEEVQEHTDTHIHMRFVANQQGIQFAHTALVRLLSWEAPKDDRPHWRGLLRKERVTANVANFSAALYVALREKVVSHILHVQPHQMPDFISNESDGGADKKKPAC